MNEKNRVNLDEAASRYLAALPVEEKEAERVAILNFVRWFGREHTLDGLTAPEVGSYAERLSLSDTDYAKKLEMVRAFLTYVKKEKWSPTNLAVHLKLRKGKPKVNPANASANPEVVTLTEEGFAKLNAELTDLKQRRPGLIADITRAAADKDVRENAPLEAAREAHGMVESRIREIETTLKTAVMMDKKQPSLKVSVGDSIVLVDMESGEELHYTIVGPRETNPSKGKISGVSPVGKAVVGHREGDTVQVSVPAGKVTYRIKEIKR